MMQISHHVTCDHALLILQNHQICRKSGYIYHPGASKRYTFISIGSMNAFLIDLNILLAVAAAIEQDPIMYSDATLGQERTKYIDWIQKTSSWGGAIGKCQLNIYVFLGFEDIN